MNHVLDEITLAMRLQAWERAKSELRCISAASFAPTGSMINYELWDKKCKRRQQVVDKFIEKMDEEELWN